MAMFLVQPKLPFDRIKYLSNNQPWVYGIFPTPQFEPRLMGYAHLGVGQISISHGWLLDKL